MEGNEPNALPPDINEHLFTIEIKVFKNCQTMKVNGFKNSITFQSVYGALDIARQAYFVEQNMLNMRAWIDLKEKQNEINANGQTDNQSSD